MALKQYFYIVLVPLKFIPKRTASFWQTIKIPNRFVLKICTGGFADYKGRSISNQEINKKDFDKANDFVTFFPGTREEVSVVIKDGCMFEVDKYWGHFIGMSLSDAKVLIHDEDKAQISMPQQIRLPLLYARALTLLTGQTPTSTFGSRTYSIGVNPCTYASASSPDTILGKLGQI